MRLFPSDGTLLSLLFAVTITSTAAGDDVFNLPRMSYEKLVQAEWDVESIFVDALSTIGMLAITNVPALRSQKELVMSTLHECALSSKATQTHVFPDGTRRRTMATHSLPGLIKPIYHTESWAACDRFDQAADTFRSTIASVTQVFSERLTESVRLQGDGPLLSTTTNHAFPSIASVVENGEHLEHFHSYEKLDDSKDATIEMHIDQGLFLVFTPGSVVDHNDPSKSTLASGFFITMPDGTITEIMFDKEDDIVFMMGDGFNQYVNDRLSPQVRAVPHTLLMETHGPTESRVWYGRMVLPPVDALHPAYEQVTFGELRERMMDASHSSQEEEEALGLGCSGGMIARDLSETTCTTDSLYCWHRCMNLTDYNVSDEICASRNLQVECINPRLQIWGGENHGDFYPACADPAVQELETPLPSLPQYPRSNETCTEDLYHAFAENASVSFENSHKLLEGNSTFMWNLVNDEVQGQLVFNGLFGWIAFGFANVGGDKNGMHGATIIMAQPGRNYSAFSGFDLTMDPVVNEHVVDFTESSFRFWMTPVADGKDSYTVETTECFTVLSFQTSSIHNIDFNLTGSDELIWAANGVDYYAGYHGPSRGRFSIDWPTATVTIDDHVHHEGEEHDHEEGDTETTTSVAWKTHTAASLTMMSLCQLVLVVICLT